MAIEAAIFDFGNVIFEEKWRQVIEKIKEHNYKVTLEQFLDAYSKEWNIYRIGKISSENYWKNVARELGFTEHAWRDLSSAFTNICQEPNEQLCNFLRSFKSMNEKFKIYALSNSCPENAIRIGEELKNGQLRFINHFYLSHIEKVAKPDESAYRNVLSTNNLDAENAIYVDDKERNIVPAKRIGMHGILYKNFEQFKEEFEDIIKSNK